MIVPSAIRRKFSDAQPHLEVVSRRVRDTVLGYCEKCGFAYVGRSKTLESLAEKIETGRIAKWSDLDDMFGCSIVIPTLAKEAEVVGFLREAFLEINTRIRGSTLKSPDVFRFEATRFYGRLRGYTEADSLNPAYRITFEVQVRSAFEHAWSAATHALVYKSGQVNWKALRLASQLKAVVEQLDMLVLAFEDSSKFIVEHAWPEIAVRRAVVDRLSGMVQQKLIPEELAPKDWSRFADSFCALVRSSKWAPRGWKAGDDFVIEALEDLTKEIQEVGPARIPRSISLFQFVFGFLAAQDIVEAPLDDFCPLLTEEFLEIFPEASRFQPGCFSFDA
jgi:ppGpp synthetase/RelA/SpoT-type nucleotidyltranferase